MSNFHTFPVADIFYNKPARQRQRMGTIEELAISIKAIGMLHPPIVTREGELIAGERRYLAAKLLGWTDITVQFRDELTDLEKERIEFDENASRLDLTWQERTLAFKRFHDLSKKIEGSDWTVDKTADRLGYKPAQAKAILRVGRALIEGDERVINAPVFSTAAGILERSDARKRDEASARVTNLIEGGPSASRPTPGVTGSDDAGLSGGDDTGVLPDGDGAPPILLADFHSWAASYSGPRFNLLHCDFPYGIDAGNHDQGAGASFGTYEDGEEVYWALMGTLQDNLDRIAEESAHLLFWYSPKFHTGTKAVLEAAGWRVNPYPLIWHRSDNSGIIPDPKRSPRQIYETAFLCSRGDRLLVKPKSNLFPSPNSKQYHMSEKPLPVLSYFLEMLVDDTTTFLDPTCGSANALIAASALGARSVLGLERSPEFHASAVENWRKNSD